MTCIMPRASAESVAGRSCSHRSALLASLLPLGSITISFAPAVRVWARLMPLFSSGLEIRWLLPQATTHFGLLS